MYTSTNGLYNCQIGPSGKTKRNQWSVMPECNMHTYSGNCIQERSAGFPMFSLITLVTLISLIGLQPRSYIKAQ